MVKQYPKNYANQHNKNNADFWKSRGHQGWPVDWKERGESQGAPRSSQTPSASADEK